MQGVVMCSRFAFSPDLGSDAEALYTYVINKKDDEGAKAIIKKYSVYTMLRLISGKNLCDAFDPRVIEAYWLGNDLLAKIGSEELGLIIKNYGWVINKEVDKLIFGNMQLPIDQRMAPHHSLSVLLGAMRMKEYSPDIIEQINNSLIMWGNVKEVHQDSLLVLRSQLVKQDTFAIEENKEESVSYDPAFVGPVQQNDVVAIHHGMVVTPLQLMQLAALKRYTERNITVFNTLA